MKNHSRLRSVESSFTRRPPALVWLTAIATCAACSSSDDRAGANGESLDPLFTDSAVPRCDGNTLYKVTGQLKGQTINIADFLLSDLEPQSFQILEVVSGNVRTDLSLTWSQPLGENKAIPLTGASIRISDGQPLGGSSFCITAGKFGSPTRPAGGDGSRQLLFEITGTRESDCNGAEVPASLRGCDYRSPSASFPAAAPSDGGK